MPASPLALTTGIQQSAKFVSAGSTKGEQERNRQGGGISEYIANLESTFHYQWQNCSTCNGRLNRDYECPKCKVQSRSASEQTLPATLHSKQQVQSDNGECDEGNGEDGRMHCGQSGLNHVGQPRRFQLYSLTNIQLKVV